MNAPPTDAVRVPADALRGFVLQVLRVAGMRTADAALLADLLVLNDLRGVFSHGTRQVATYARDLRAGRLNPRPAPRLEGEGSTWRVDGDGGLGYFPAYAAAHALVPHARAAGVAVAVTGNHGHIGAAGLYTRVLAAAGLAAFCTSGHQLALAPGRPFPVAAGGSPMSFAVPTRTAPPFALDFGTMHDLYESSPHARQLFELAPGLVFRSIGLGAVCQVLGGFLAGVPARAERSRRAYPGANQGAFLLAVDVARFLPLEAFRAEMDDYARQVATLEPMPGHARAALPGTPEWEHEAAWAQEGVPVGTGHAAALRALGEELGVAFPA